MGSVSSMHDGSPSPSTGVEVADLTVVGRAIDARQLNTLEGAIVQSQNANERPRAGAGTRATVTEELRLRFVFPHYQIINEIIKLLELTFYYGF